MVEYKVVSQETYDEASDSMKDALKKFEAKTTIKAPSGVLRKASKWKDIDIKYSTELEYLQQNSIYDDLFDSDGKIDNNSMKFWTKELKVGKNKDVWVLLARADYLNKKAYLESLTVEEDNSSAPKTTIDDFNKSSDCSEDDIKELKSNKGK